MKVFEDPQETFFKKFLERGLGQSPNIPFLKEAVIDHFTHTECNEDPDPGAGQGFAVGQGAGAPLEGAAFAQLFADGSLQHFQGKDQQQEAADDPQDQEQPVLQNVAQEGLIGG